MKDGAKIKSGRKAKKKRNDAPGRTLNSIISSILKELAEKCAKDKGNLHITGEDICLFIKELNEKVAVDDKSKDSALAELKLFSHVEHYYRFHIQNRLYQSFRVEFKKQGEEDRAALEGKFSDLINFAYDYKKDKAKKANAYNLCSILIQHIIQALNPDPESDQSLQHGECNREVDGGYMRSGYVPLNDYHKSELLTWDRLLQEDDRYEHSVYPYCKFQQLDDHERVILLIVTKLDETFVDEKVKKVDKIPPVHMIILKSPGSINLGESELEPIEFKLRHAVGYLSYTVFAGRTNESLVSMSTEAALVARHWYSDGIDKLFAESEREEKTTGVTVSSKIVKEMLCADVEGLETLEVFPFDRAFLFPGSNFRVLKMDSSTKRWDTNPMKLTVLEAAVKSKRPQDNDRFLSAMERLEKKVDHSEQPNLDIFFDVTQKNIGYTTEMECSVNTDGKYELKIVDSEQKTGFEKIVEELEVEDIDLKDEKEQIDAVIKTMFSGFTKEDDDRLQEYCQRTYEYYDADGLCLLSDFATKIEDIGSLKKIQDAYFDIFFKKEKKDWDNLWIDTPQNKPEIEEFKKWQIQRESKVIFISFDPYQNLSNMDQEGKRYMEQDDAFTLILIADQDVVKNRFDLDTEILDLRQMLLMIIRRQLREAKMQKEVIRGQKKLFTTMMSSIMHRFKSYTSHPAQRKELDTMRESFENVLTNEDYSASYREFNSIQDVSGYLLNSFIEEQLDNKPLPGIGLQENFEAACKEYLGELKRLKKIENIGVKELIIKFNENYLPRIQVKLRDEFVMEAVKILITNAIEHTVIFAQETKNKAEIIISFNLSYQLENDLYSFEFNIVNSSFPIPPEKLENLNSPDPQQAEKDDLKASSTGIGIFIARTQLQKSAGKGADIRLDNVGENYVEAKMTLPAKKVIFHDDKIADKEDTPHTAPTETGIGYSDFNYILYIEDNVKYQKNSKEALLKLLRDENRLFVCDNQQEAVLKIKHAQPAIILMDLSILRKPKGRDPMPHYAHNVIKEVLKKESTTPIVILSHSSAKDIKNSLMKLELGNYRVYISEFDRDVTIEERTIIIPSHDIKDLSKDEGKNLLKTLGKWIKTPGKKPADVPISDGGSEMQRINMRQFSEVKFNDKDFDEKLEDYRKRNISDDIPDEVFVASADVDSDDLLFETISRWFSHPGLKSFFEDEQDDDQDTIPLTENAPLPTVFLNVRIENKFQELIDIKFKYWCLYHNILISSPMIKIDPVLAGKWRFTPHGDRGSLSTMRHDIKNKLSNDEGKDIIEKIDAVEKKLLFEEKLDSNLKQAFKTKKKSIMTTLKNRQDKENTKAKKLFKELDNAITTDKAPEQFQTFKGTVENLQEFLDI